MGSENVITPGNGKPADLFLRIRADFGAERLGDQLAAKAMAEDGKPTIHRHSDQGQFLRYPR